MQRWAVADTGPRSEDKGFEHARLKGFECFLPKIRNRKKKLEPLFPRYLFVLMNSNNWRMLLSTIGIADVIKSGNTPLTMSENVLDTVRTRCDAEGVYLYPASRFKPNQKVLLKTGPFMGSVGFFHMMSKKDRAIVLLSMLGTEARVEVLEDDLAAA